MLLYTPHNYYILSTIYAIEPITMTMSIVHVHSNQSCPLSMSIATNHWIVIINETAVADGRTDRQTDKISFGQLAKLVEQMCGVRLKDRKSSEEL